MKSLNQKIEALLERGVDEIISKKHLEKALRSEKKLRVKLGIDPTSATLHLGHAVPLRKLKQFQELGHKVVFLIGDFTATIGDPSARTTARKLLTRQEIKRNMTDYIEQAAKILNMKKAEVRYNSEWYSKKRADFLMELTSRFTYARLIERDDFKKRIAKETDVSMIELVYPLLQGYDSVELKADLEIGGTDQKFNLLMGRKVQKKYKQPQQDIMTVPLLMGTDGVKKMSKSYDNYIGLTEAPLKMYGKTMSIPDTIIWHYFQLLTDVPLREVKEMEKKIASATLNPREAKARLAREIVAAYYGERAALTAEKEFNHVFKEKRLPFNVPTVSLKQKEINILDLLTKTKLASSRSEAKRLVEQRGVKIAGAVQADWRKRVKLKKGTVVQVGKRRFLKII